MIAILTESFAGKWPFWLSPRQAIVIPVGPQFDEYSEKASYFFHCFIFYCINIIHIFSIGKKRNI